MTRSPAQPRSFKVGERSVNRVRLAEDPRRSGRLFVEFREHTGKKVRLYLTHRDWTRAKAYAETLAAAHRAGPVHRDRATTLHALFDIYVREVTPTKAPTTHQHDRAAAALFLAAWGPSRSLAPSGYATGSGSLPSAGADAWYQRGQRAAHTMAAFGIVKSHTT